MPRVSHFDEKAGLVLSPTPWGRWSQTVWDVTIEVDLPDGTRANHVYVDVASPRKICCRVSGETEFQGDLFGPVKHKEVIWSIEDKKLLRIVLNKAEASVKESVWTSLLIGQFDVSKEIFPQMKEKLDLERFQLENPQYNFANWKQMAYTQQVAIPLSEEPNDNESVGKNGDNTHE